MLLKLLPIYASVSVSSSTSYYYLLFCFSLRPPPGAHINLPWGNLSPLPPCLLPCSGLLSSSSVPSFVFCFLAGFHLECTSNSLGATSLWPAGLPKAIEYAGSRRQTAAKRHSVKYQKLYWWSSRMPTRMTKEKRKSYQHGNNYR